MKNLRTVICIFLLGCMAFGLSACSVTDVFDDIVSETGETQEESETTAASSAELVNIDTDLALPVFESDLEGSAPISLGSAFDISCPAKSTDGGTITYQWYVNNVDSNGGGTPIEGATDSFVTAKPDETGSTFYYVVAANNHGDSCNMITSGTFEVITLNSGKWTTDENGTRYVAEDETYPTSIWMIIDGDTYCFDVNGYRVEGWYGDDPMYYFDESGKLLRNSETPDGCKTDESGALIEGTPDLGQNTDTNGSGEDPSQEESNSESPSEETTVEEPSSEETVSSEENYEETPLDETAE